jgi:NAD(P)-dependent dehydrogenase (short-subunit alcohol dehydrogenase family)
MDLQDSTIVITGAGSGIGAALAGAFVAAGAAHLVLCDIAEEGLDRVAAQLSDGPAVTTPTVITPAVTTPAATTPTVTTHVLDVRDDAAVRAAVESTVAERGWIDLYCSNAGVATGAGIDATDSVWQRTWDVNVMGSVNAARALLELTAQRHDASQRTRLMITASAAGLLTNLGDAPYSVTKAAAVSLAEWLSITHDSDGLDVSCLCPQGVRTPMVTGGIDHGDLGAEVVEAMGLIEPEACAAAALAGLIADEFLILPHPEVAEFRRRKVSDTPRWLAGMRRLEQSLRGRPTS